MKRLEQDRIDLIVSLYEAGMTAREVANKTGHAENTVQGVLRGLGKTRKIGFSWPIEDMRKWYEKDGMTIQQIADRLGRSQKLTNKVAKRNGFQMRRRGPARGDRHPGWNGGTTVGPNGYIRQYAPDHPYCSGTYVMQHRLVMEAHLGRYLEPHEVVHHINGVTNDNRIENLELFSSNAEHLAATLAGKCPQWTEDGKKRIADGVAKPGRIEASVAARRRNKLDAASSQRTTAHSITETDIASHIPSETACKQSAQQASLHEG